MKMNKDQNTCVRIDRDVVQIERCKSQVLEVNSQLLETTQILALAGNEARLKILYLLQNEKKLCVCDLSEILEMKIPAVSQHLRKMKDAGLVYAEREGTVIFYHLSTKATTALNPIFQLILEGVMS